MRLNFLTPLEWVLVGLIALSASFTVLCGVKLYRLLNDGGSVATATIGRKKYEVAEIQEQRPSYLRFKTTDGRVVEVVEDEVKVK